MVYNLLRLLGSMLRHRTNNSAGVASLFDESVSCAALCNVVLVFDTSFGIFDAGCLFNLAIVLAIWQGARQSCVLCPPITFRLVFVAHKRSLCSWIWKIVSAWGF